jgi:hypothetical protein
MPQDTARKPKLGLNIKAYLFAGILVITPLAAVWLVFNFLLGILYGAGRRWPRRWRAPPNIAGRSLRHGCRNRGSSG